MAWFRPSPKEHPREIRVPQIRFIGSQDGTPEHKLKECLIESFRRDQSVKAAYLARVSYGKPTQTGVALCLRTQFGPDRGMAERVGKIFASLFGSHEHLDIIFPTIEQEVALAKVCAPFFSSADPKGPGANS